MHQRWEQDFYTDSLHVGATGAAQAKKGSQQGKHKAGPSKPPRRTVGAISRSGHTKAGRVRQKSHKQAEIVAVGTLRRACFPCTLSSIPFQSRTLHGTADLW